MEREMRHWRTTLALSQSIGIPPEYFIPEIYWNIGTSVVKEAYVHPDRATRVALTTLDSIAWSVSKKRREGEI